MATGGLVQEIKRFRFVIIPVTSSVSATQGLLLDRVCSHLLPAGLDPDHVG